MITLSQCSGCHDDFYNHRTNCDGASRCWSAKSGRMVTRFAIGKWTAPTERFAFTEVRVPSCYHQQSTAYYEKLPGFVKLEDVVRKSHKKGKTQ